MPKAFFHLQAGTSVIQGLSHVCLSQPTVKTCLTTSHFIFKYRPTSTADNKLETVAAIKHLTGGINKTNEGGEGG